MSAEPIRAGGIDLLRQAALRALEVEPSDIVVEAVDRILDRAS